MDRWAGKVAIVTGASAGIGLATVEALVREGMTVVGLARRKQKMEDHMKTFKGKRKFYALECDISKEENVTQTFQWVKKNLGSVHVLVNNAGVLLSGKIIDTNKEVWDKVVGVNIMGLLCCTQQALKMMKESGEEGHIININSIVGHRIIRNSSMSSNIYSATKHAVTAITSTLEVELLGSKIRSTSISPGLVQTDIFSANLKNADFLGKIENLPALKSEDVADAILYVLGTPTRVQITELTIRPLGEQF
ncbi:farnesol dehydrogenase-like [Belonocnema kinseyi]|uniref:farnesol dehydrogenase-like n=1 Tax=Belonocnema kinseyi TaxID=2817044 RepID=UPI00143D529A|nr:farnesol dehydrogenase-like [Belonocnema kinseyi]XP_033212946.1 farnesol dehydrogenase-like [Belonocnema kinseyi]